MLRTLNRTVQSSFRTFQAEVTDALNGQAKRVYTRLPQSLHGREAGASLRNLKDRITSWVIDLEPIADQDPVIQQMVWQMKNAIGQLQDAQRCVEPYAFQVHPADVRYAQFKVKDVKRILQGIERQLVRK
jgi:hypothetical protein|nr:MAG TPA: hypothetical protein [Caudoviricetes sp.]